MQIPNPTTNELTKLATEIPKMQEVTLHSLNAKLKEINSNYPWSMPDWLKIGLTITSTIVGVVFMVVMIYLRRTGNCMLLGKHLNKKSKSKSISRLPHNKGIELKELNCPQKSTMLRPLSSTSTNNSLKSMTQRELPLLSNTSEYLPDSPLLEYYQAQDKDKYKQPTDDSNIRIPAAPDSVKSFLEDVDLDFSKYDKYRVKANSHYLIPPLPYKN